MKVCKQTNAGDSDSVWRRLSTGNPRNIWLLHLSSIKITIWPGRDQKITIYGARGALSIFFPWNIFTHLNVLTVQALFWEILKHFLCDIPCISCRVDCWSACFPFFWKVCWSACFFGKFVAQAPRDASRGIGKRLRSRQVASQGSRQETQQT